MKAVAWCPWQSGILATGGGASDKTIKIWNINSGSLVSSVETKSQVRARGAIAQSVGRPSKVSVWRNLTGVGSNHKKDMSSASLSDIAAA